MIKPLELILNIIYPRICVQCSNKIPYNLKSKWYCDNCSKFEFIAENTMLCEKCGKIIEHSGRCIFCNENETYFDKGYVLYKYDESVKRLIINFKFHNKSMYSDFFAENMFNYAQKYIIKNYDFVCSVPLHKRKRAIRGYNQSEIVAKKFADLMNYVYNPVLIKVKNTKQQSSLSSKERKNNVKNAFVCNYDIANKDILIIDDVITTGYTLNECCRVLKKAGAKTVDFMAIATPCVNKL